LLILSDFIPFCAATRRNLVADDCAAVALERIEPDGSPTRPFPQHQVSTGSYLTVNRAPALPTAPSARNGIPVKQAQGLHSSSDDDNEPPQLVSGGFEGSDTMAAMCIERMKSKGTAAGSPVICWAHVQGLGRGQAASYGAPCTNQAAELDSREQRKAEAGAPPVLIPPIPELDQQRLISSKVSSIFFSLCLSSHCGPLQCPGPPRRRHHPSKTTRRQVHLSISVWAAYTTQLILHAVSYEPAIDTGPLTCAVPALSRFPSPARGTVMFRK
jgi:hypothetical protein